MIEEVYICCYLTKNSILDVVLEQQSIGHLICKVTNLYIFTAVHQRKPTQFNSQPEVLELHFSQLVPVGVLKCIPFKHSNLPYFIKHHSVDNECKCQILSMLLTFLGLVFCFFMDHKVADLQIQTDVVFHLFYTCHVLYTSTVIYGMKVHY